MKRIWLMGKVRDLDLKKPKEFEDGVNDDLANYNGNDFKGGFETTLTSPTEAIFHWKLSLPKEKLSVDPDVIPMEMWMLITGECKAFQPAYDLEVYSILKVCPNAIITYIAEDLCDLYKKNSKHYGADKFKKVNIQFNPDIGLKMTIKF